MTPRPTIPPNDGDDEELGDYDAFPTNAQRGLTIRELFAIHAMQGLLAGNSGNSGNSLVPKQTAKMSVKLANALIKELDKNY